MKATSVDKDVLKIILKDCSLYERIVIKLFYREFAKVYKIGITFGFNNK